MTGLKELAIKAGFEFNSLGGTFTSGKLDQHLERFAQIVAAAEREACAKLCDEMARLYDLSIDPVEELIACETSAAIRART